MGAMERTRPGFFVVNTEGTIVGTSENEDLSTTLPKCLQQEYRTVPVAEFLDGLDSTEPREVVSDLMQAACQFPEVWSTNGLIKIEIEWGDWKHNHLFVDHLMKAIGYTKIDERVTEEDGSDCYSATHTYKKEGK